MADLPALERYAAHRSAGVRLRMPWLRLKAAMRGRAGRHRLEDGLGRGVLTCGCAGTAARHVVAYCHNIGEVRTALPLVTELRSRMPALRYVVWTKSVVAYAAARDILPEPCGVFYAPLDDLACVDRALGEASATTLLILEGDLRPTMVLGARRRGIPVAFVSGGLSPVEMKRHSRNREGQREMLEALDLLALKSGLEADRARRIGVAAERIWVSGSCRYDIADLDLTLPPGDLPSFLEAARAAGRPILVAGSTYAREERALATLFMSLHGDNHRPIALVAPRKVGRSDQVEATFAGTNLRVARRSHLPPIEDAQVVDVVVLDTMGELAGAYGLGDICFVGGSLVNKGGHNIIEAAVHGRPVVFGPSLFNNEEISARLVALGGGLKVDSADELAAAAQSLLGDTGLRERMGTAARQAVLENAGAVGRTVEKLLPILGV